MPDITPGVHAKLDVIIDDLEILLKGGNTATVTGPQFVAPDMNGIYAVEVQDIDGPVVAEERIVPGTYSLWRRPHGTTTGIEMVASAVPTAAAGGVYFEYTFDSGDGWALGDMFVIAFNGIEVLSEDLLETVTYFAGMRFIGIISESTPMDVDVAAIKDATVDSTDHSNEVLRDVLDVIDGVVDGIAGDVTTALGNLGDIETKIDTIDGIVDTIASDAVTIKGYTDILDDGTYGLIALKTLIDALPSDADVLTQVKAALQTPVGAGWTPTAGSLADALHKDGSYTYSKATDSLEAIRDYVADGTGGLPKVLDYCDKIDDATYGLTSIYGQAANAASYSYRSDSGLGREYCANPEFTSSYTGWALYGSSTLAHYSSAYRSAGYCERAIITAADSGMYYDCGTGSARQSARYYVSAWVYVTSAGRTIRAEIDSSGGASPVVAASVSPAANTWTRIEGIATLGSGQNGNLYLRVLGDASCTFYVDDVSIRYLDQGYLDYGLRRTWHKDTNLTFDPSTDSLEALRDRLDVVSAGQAAVRNGDSGATTMDGSEQTLFEESDTAPWHFKGGWVDLTNLADTRSVTIRLYVKVKSGGTYREVSEVALTGAADALCYPIPQSIPIGGTTYKCIVPDFWNVYGAKVTAEQTVVGGGYIAVDHEWFASK